MLKQLLTLIFSFVLSLMLGFGIVYAQNDNNDTNNNNNQTDTMNDDTPTGAPQTGFGF